MGVASTSLVEARTESSDDTHSHRIATIVIGRDRVLWEGLRSLLPASEFDVICAVEDVARFSTTKVTTAPADLILRDLSTGATDLKSELQHLRSIMPDVHVVAITERFDPTLLSECVAAGVQGLLKKDITADVLARSLRMVMLGEKVFPTRLTGLLVSGKVEARSPVSMPDANPRKLSKREMQIAHLVARGESNKMIASRLVISESTVKGHMNNLLRKTNASNRTQAAIWAIRESGVEPTPQIPHSRRR